MQRIRFAQFAYPVELTQLASGEFRVTYGAHERRQLSYEEAAAELGACLLHSATCAGQLMAGPA